MNSIFAKIKCWQEKFSTFWLSKLITITILFVSRDAHAQAHASKWFFIELYIYETKNLISYKILQKKYVAH